MVRKMEREFIIGLMGRDMRESTKVVSKMEREFIIGLMETGNKESTKMV